MDIVRPATVARQRKRRRIVYAAVGIVVVALVTMGLSRLKPAAPGVDRSTVWIDTVKRGPMLRQVRGLGTLTPVDIQWIPAATDGRVEKIPVLPGTAVQPNTVLLILTNPQLMQEALDANLKLKAAQADYKNLEAQLESQVLTQKSLVAQVSAEYNEARMQAETDQERLTNSNRVLQAQLLAKQAEIEQDRALSQLKQTQVQNLVVRAGIKGVLQEQPLKVGQWVTPGTTLAKVVQPDHLKAELKIPETQAKDIQLNQPASVDTHNGVIAGHVMRIDPAVYNGTVTVDVMLDDPLPPGARPDLSVDGTIDLERLSNVLYVGRPAFGQENSTVGMFVLQPDGKTAVRAQVKLGRSSVNTVEILGGLKDGDQVILSDMSRWDNFDRIRLE